MPLSFTLAIIVEVLTLLWCGFVLLANGMSDNPSISISPGPSFVGGTILAIMLVMSHWFGW
jgi:hypothetical protein